MSTVRRRTLLTLALIALVVVMAPGSARPTVRAGDSVNDAISEQQRMEAELARQRQQLADLRRQQAALTVSLATLTTDLKRTGLELAKAQRQLERVTASLEESRTALESYRAQIAHLAENLRRVAADLVTTRTELAEREVLLEDHLRLAYEQSQTSMLEVLLSTDSFGEASNQLASMLTLSDEDRRLAAEIRETRQRLAVRQQTLRDGQVTLTASARRREGADAGSRRPAAPGGCRAGRRCASMNAALEELRDAAGGAVPPVGAQRAAHQGADR